MGWHMKRFTNHDSIIEDLICSICMEVLDEPVQAPCEHLFCKKCIEHWLDQGKKSCPVDGQQLRADILKSPSKVTQKLLNNLTIRCQNHVEGCHLECKLEYINQLIQHEQKGCQASNIEKKSEINDSKKKIMELQVALSLEQTTINDNEKLIRDHEETISNLKSSIEINNAMEASSFPPSAQPVELLKSMSIAPKCPDLVNKDSLQGIRSIHILVFYLILVIRSKIKKRIKNIPNCRCFRLLLKRLQAARTGILFQFSPFLGLTPLYTQIKR